MPNTFSECDEKIARLEKENKSLKAQIEECKGIKGRHRKLTFSTRRFEKRIFEKILSKIKQDIFKSHIGMISIILSFSGDDKPNDLNQNEKAPRFDKKFFERFLSKIKQDIPLKAR